jgi:Ala-tRNA(Pro) deacylase
MLIEYRGDQLLYKILSDLEISFDYYEHPAVPTVEEASKYWVDIEAAHCKNLFFRNHKGNRHYLVVLNYTCQLNIRELEQRLKQGKLTFASPERMMRFLGLTPGSVSPFGLIHDKDHHVYLFIDENLRRSERISFHPNLNTASIVVVYSDFLKFLEFCGNDWEYVSLYE